MKKVQNTEELLADLTSITNEGLTLATKKLVHYKENQLSWAPKEGEWSINEVLAHLNSYAKYFHKVFSVKMEKTKFRNPKENFVSSPLGKSAWKSMKLGRANNIKRKFKAPKNYNPSLNPELLEGNQVEKFKESQSQLNELLGTAKSINLRKVKVPIHISRIVRLRLGDAFMFLVYHNERHIQQIKNIIKHPDFPKK